MGEFVKQRTYDGRFSDIKGKWHEKYIADLYEYGLAEGMSDTEMAPDEPVTVAQVIAFAARINAKYYDGTIGQAGEGKWYEPYISYARDYGLIDRKAEVDAERPATRGESALIFSRALPDWQFDAVNAAGGFSDVAETDACFAAVSLLCRAGVINGYEDGLFRPEGGISRAEVMTIAGKTVNKSLRRGYSESSGGGSNEETKQPEDNKWHANDKSGTFVSPGLAMVNADFEKGSFTMAVTADKNGGMVTFSGVCETKMDADGTITVSCAITDRAAQGGASTDVADKAAKLTALAFKYDGGRTLVLTEAVLDGKMLNSSSAADAKPVYVVGMLYIGTVLSVAN